MNAAASDRRMDSLDGLQAALRTLAERSTGASVAARRAELGQPAVMKTLTEHLPRGMFVVVEVGTWDFVHAESRSAALKAFLATFGPDATGWVIEHAPASVGFVTCS